MIGLNKVIEEVGQEQEDEDYERQGTEVVDMQDRKIRAGTGHDLSLLLMAEDDADSVLDGLTRFSVMQS